MGLRAKLGKLQKAMRGNLESFELANGQRYFFDPQEASKVTFLYFADSMTADYLREPRPEAPPILVAVTRARDRGQALALVMGGFSHLPIDRDVLIERGEIKPRSLVAGKTYDEILEAP